MTPAEFMQKLEWFSDKGDAEGLLTFGERFGPQIESELSNEQRELMLSLGHWAAMLTDMRAAAASTSALPSLGDLPRHESPAR